MPKLPLGRVEPGRKLARPVINANGVVLVQAGTTLTPALIDRLKGLGIDAVTIAAQPGEAGGRLPIEEQLRELDARFAGHEQDRVMMQIKDVVARQLRDRSTDHD